MRWRKTRKVLRVRRNRPQENYRIPQTLTCKKLISLLGRQKMDKSQEKEKTQILVNETVHSEGLTRWRQNKLKRSTSNHNGKTLHKKQEHRLSVTWRNVRNSTIKNTIETNRIFKTKRNHWITHTHRAFKVCTSGSNNFWRESSSRSILWWEPNNKNSGARCSRTKGCSGLLEDSIL